ncbi:glycoside hydrolase family 65 protein [Bacteroides sp.]|uniref:glycosyl hydrolase family 95 catalytic domain-containing protein n=1 Tax=Bacteroides sp. TaxID=29523 RepID=UPI00258FFA6E|nr:glycoside hydrolase family 65 protein [Bacteroides sp.]
MNLERIISVCLLLCVLLPLKAQNPWVVEAEQIDASNYYGITVANGMLGVVSSPNPLEVGEVVLAGVYDKFGRGRVSNFLPSYNLLNLKMSLGGKRVNLNSISNYKQKLDFKKAEFSASFDLEDIATVEYTYRALRHLPHCVLMDIDVIMKKDGKMVVDNLLTTPHSLKEQQNYFNQIYKSHVHIPLLTSIAKSPSGNVTIAASSAFMFEESVGEEPKVIHKMNDNDSHIASFTLDLNKGQRYSFALVGTLISSVQNADPYNQAERSTIFAYLEGKEKLKYKHYAEWERLWESDIQIEGDKQAQQDVRSMLYHLYSFSRPNTDFSPSPMGLSGLGYNGHVFWDSELFMFPPLLFLQPELAESLVNYRFNRLEAAKKNATIYGYKGAMYPWESADTGTEETPVWALTGPFEHHITADVGIAAWNYYLVTKDKEWLAQRGWPILKETANFWVSRVSKNEKGEYEIKNVVAADEWAENVDNNAFTNGATIRLLKSAVQCANELKVNYPKEWEEISQNIPIRQLPNGVTSEYDGYDGENIKQADVNLLAYPLGIITDAKQIDKDLKYYSGKVPYENTPAMTQAIFALLYSRLGQADEAYHWFKDSYEPNLLPPFRVIAETKGGINPYFATGAGGILQSVIMGFCGVDITEKGDIRQVKSVMPKHWTKVTVTGVGKDKQTFTRK